MQHTKLSLFDLFDQTKRYSVPYFQRAYSWRREDHWEPLWENIRQQAELSLKKAMNHPHFLGTMVVQRADTYGLELTTNEIIDGQQRLTTFQIFCAAFRDVAAKLDQNALAGDIQKLIFNTGRMKDPTVEKYKVYASLVDRSFFQAVLDTESEEELTKAYPKVEEKKKRIRILERPKHVEAYQFFFDSIIEFSQAMTGESQTSTDILDAIFEVLRRGVEIIVLELQDGDDAQVIFESLNGLGEPLLPSDLIKNTVLMAHRPSAHDRTADFSPVDFYKKHWQHFDEYHHPKDPKRGTTPFWRIQEGQGRNYRARLDLFIQHYLAMKLQRDINVSKLHREFQNYMKVATRDSGIEALLIDLNTFAKTFMDFLVPEQTSRFGLFLYRIRMLEISTAYPFLLALLHKTNLEEELGQIIVDIESYLVRRSVCGLTPKAYNKIFLSLGQEALKDKTVDAMVVRRFLIRLTGDNERWPSDKEFENSWMTRNSYLSLSKGRVRSLLEALETQEHTGKQEKLHIDEKLTIEHILPQSWEKSWGIPVIIDGAALPDEEPKEYRNRLLHTFGNLTLLNNKLNSAASNGPYSEKRPEITRQSLLKLNAYFQDKETWSEKEIMARGAYLYKVALAVWPKLELNGLAK
jgi:uncharacterized protein with ParB-like and HNH nuclease domain